MSNMNSRGHGSIRAAHNAPPGRGFWLLVEQRSAMSEYERVKTIRSGFSLDWANATKEAFQVSATTLSQLLGLSVATYERRRKDAKPLDVPASERLDRIAEVAKLAQDVFEDREEATRWLAAPNEALRGTSPLLHCDTEIGARQVRRILHAMEWGGVV